jgi:ABC-type transporter Mla subunit MlaD
VAAQLGVTPDRLLQALGTAKQASVAGSIDGAAAAAAVAADLHVSRSAASHALTELFGASHSGKPSGAPPDQPISTLASVLGVSRARALQVFDALNRLSRPGHGVDPTSAAFARLAGSLGRTPTQLANALDRWKHELAAAQPSSPSPRPTK